MKGKAMRKVLSLLIVFNLMFQQAGFAQGIAQLDISKYLGAFSGPQQFRPLQMRYFSYNPLTDNFQMLLDKGTLKKVEDSQLKAEGQELLKYFLVGVALPDENFWVNLRPDSEDEIISRELAGTDLGKVLLEADLQLKKDVARFTSPETAEGREYWNKLYRKAGQIFTSSEITIPTLTRPWIVPGEVIIRENANSAYVYKGVLKVMLEQDHLKNSPDYNFKDPRLKELNEYSSELIRETIIPKLTKEVNSSKRYAALRQVFFSLILSRWFKHKFAGKTGQYASLINSGNLNGLTSQQAWSKTTYFDEYKKSFAQGEYNLKEQINSVTGPVIRSYFSGGITVANVTFTEGNQSALSFSGLRDAVSRVIKDRMVPLAESSSPATQPSAASPIKGNSTRIKELENEKTELEGQIARIEANIAEDNAKIAELEPRRFSDKKIPLEIANLERQNELSRGDALPRVNVQLKEINDELKRLRAGKVSSPVAQGSIGQRQLTFAFIESLSGRKERPDKYVHHLRSNPFPDIPRFGTVQELQIQYRPNPQDRSSDYYEIRFFSDKSMNGHPKNPEMRFFSVNAYRNGKTDIYGIDGDPEELSAAIMKALQEYAETSNRHEDLVRALRQGVPSLDTSFIEKITSNKSRFYNYGYSLRSEPFPDIPKFGTVRKLQIQDQRNRDGNIAYYRIIFISDKGINSLSNSERLSFSINVYPNTTYDILIDRNVIGAAGGAEALAAAIMKALQEYGKASNSSEQLAWPLKEAMTADVANPDKGVALGTIIADLMERQRVVSNRPDAASSPVAQSVVKLENIIATLEAVIANISEGKEVDAENVARLLRLAYELKGRAKGFSLGITPFRRGTILFSEGSVYLVKEEYTKQVDPRYHSHGYVFDGWYWNPEEGLSTFQKYPVHGGIPVYSSTTTLTVNDIKALLFEQLSSLSLGNLSLRERLRWYTLWLEVGSADKDPQFDEKMGAWLRQNREFLLLIADQHGNKPVKRNTLIFDKESGSVTFVKNVIDNSVFGKKFQNGSWKDVLREPVPSGGMVTLETLQKLIVALDKEQQASSPVSALQGVVDEILKDTNTGQLSLTGNQREVIANALPEDRSKVIREIESRIIGNITVPFVYKGDNFEDLISQVPFGVINKPFIRRALSLRRTILRDAAQPKSGSPLTATTTEGVGGIDFRVITMITQPMGNLSGLNFSLPRLSNLENINLDEELGQIQRMLEAGIIPSGERLKEYVAACYQKGELKEHLDGIVGSLVDTCKLEEEKADVTSNALKEVMLILDSVS